MKKFIPTLVLVIICVAALIYAKSHSYFQDKPKDANKPLFSIQAADVQAFSITGIGDPLELDKKSGSWQMTKPAAYPLNNYEPDGWVGSFTGLTYDDKIDENPSDLAQYGLDKAYVQFQVTLKDGTVKKLTVGKQLPIAGDDYVKLDDSPVVYSVSEQSLQQLGKQPTDFLDKSAIAYSPEKIKGISMEWKGDKWSMTKTEADKPGYQSKWKTGDNKELTPDQGYAILQKLVALTTDQLPKPAAQVKIDSPELKLDLTDTDKGKDTTTTYLGKVDKDYVWIAKQGGAWVYPVPIKVVQDLQDIGKNPLAPQPSQSTPPAASPSK